MAFNNNVLVLTFLGKDQFSPISDKVASKLDQVGRKVTTVSKTSDNFSKVGKKLALTLGPLVGIQVFKSFIENAAESARLGRITENVIRSTGGAAHVTAADVDKLSTSLSNKTGVDDEVIQSGANMLLTFTGIRNEVGKGNNIFDQATGAVTDMAAAMNNGQVTSEGIRASSIQLGKALSDPIKGITALTRVGVTFTAQQKEQIKALVASGHTLEAQKIILGEVNKEFGGTAAAASDPLQKLTVIVDNLSEQVGRALYPTVQKFADWMGNTGAPILSSFADAMGKIPPQAFAIAGGLVVAYKGFFLVKRVVEGLGSIVEIASKAFGRLVVTTTATAVAEGEQAVAAGASATATTASGNAAAGAAVKFRMLSGAFLGVGIAVGGITLGNWLQDISTAKPPVDALAQSLQHLSDNSKNSAFRQVFSRASLGSFRVDAQGASEAMEQFSSAANTAFGQGWLEKTQRIASFGVASRQASQQIEQVDASLAQLTNSGHLGDAQNAFHALTQRLREAGWSETEIIKMFPQYTAATDKAIDVTIAHQKAVSGLADQQLNEGVAMRGAASATRTASKANDVATISAGRLLAQLQKLSDQTLTLRGSDRDLAGAYADLTDSIKTNGRTLSDNTAKGRANGNALDLVAQKTLVSLKAHKDSHEPLRVYAQRVATVRDRLIDEAQKAGMSTQAAKRYTLAILGVPIKQTTAYLTPGLKAARANVAGLKNDINHISGRTVTIRVNSDGSVTRILQSAGHVESHTMRARGGWINGPGGPTGDKIPAWLSDGEYVVNAASARMFAPLLEGINARKFATGGPVTVKTNTRLPVGIGGMFASGFGNIMNTLYADVRSALKSQSHAAHMAHLAHMANMSSFGPVSGFSGSGGVARWRPMVLQALAAQHLSPLLVGKVLRQIQTESGGNPNAVQGVHDVNWPNNRALGLLQVIPPTFRAFHWPGTSWNEFNPWANIMAALNYAKHRYGPGLSALGQGHGYDRGGLANRRGLLAKFTNDPERILSPRQTKWFERAMALGARSDGGHGHGGVTLVLSAPNYVGSRNELLDEFNRFARQGRLDAIVRMAGR